MNEICKISGLRMHPNYERLADLTCESHAKGRTPLGILQADIALGRLYSYSFRSQSIGAFHATRRALEAVLPVNSLAAVYLARAKELLADLANRSMDIVGEDVRGLISTFHHYCTHVARTMDALNHLCDLQPNGETQRIRSGFVRLMEEITSGNGLRLVRDDAAPDQGSFVVPNLGIKIVPLVYGDHHSWNLAWLDGARADVPYHLHRAGVEIHLGYSPMHGHTVLGEVKAELTEGYAMPIPPDTRHGYTNIGGAQHHVPFVFGSLTYGGWGVFLDVEPMPVDLSELANSSLLSHKLNGTVFLEREIERVVGRTQDIRYAIIPADKTFREGVGGLELSISRITTRGMEFYPDHFCIFSVVRGRGRLEMAGEQVDIGVRDHFGIPSGMKAVLSQIDSQPLVLLDAVLQPTGRKY